VVRHCREDSVAAQSEAFRLRNRFRPAGGG
jgi:hypothetical protein